MTAKRRTKETVNGYFILMTVAFFFFCSILALILQGTGSVGHPSAA